MQRSYGLDTHIRQQGLASGTQKKRLKTRDGLRLAMIHLLDNRTYLDIQVKDVCEKAGVGIGTFYRNYDNLRALIHELVIDFVTMYSKEVATKRARDRSAFSYMFHANRIYINFARDNLGLARCFFQIADTDVKMKNILVNIKSEWAQRVATSIEKNAKTCSYANSVFAAQAMGSMTDDMVRRLVIIKDDHLLQLCKELNLDDDRLAEYLAMIWYRVLFLKDPDELQFFTQDEMSDANSALGDLPKVVG